MDQLWTIVFVFVVAAAFAVAHWHDRDDAKKSEPGAVTAPGSDEPRVDVYGRRPPSYNEGMKAFERKRAGYLVAVFGVASLTGVMKLFGEHVNSTTVALGLLLVVLFVATAWGSRPAVLASLLGVMCFNFFYLPPVGRWTLAP